MTTTTSSKRSVDSRRSPRARWFAAVLLGVTVLATACPNDAADQADRDRATPRRNTAADDSAEAVKPSAKQAVLRRIADAAAALAAEPSPVTRGGPTEPIVPASAGDIAGLCSAVTFGTEPSPDTVMLKSSLATSYPIMPIGAFRIKDCVSLYDWVFDQTLSGAKMSVVPAPGMLLRCSTDEWTVWFGSHGADRGGAFAPCWLPSSTFTPIEWQVTDVWGSLQQYGECNWCDFTTLDVAGKYLGENRTYRHADFSGTDLSGSFLSISTIEDSNFDGATLNGVTALNLDVRRTTFRGAVIRDSDFAASRFVDVDFGTGDEPTRIVRTTLPVQMDDVVFDDAQLLGVDTAWMLDGALPYGLFGCTSFRNVVLSGLQLFTPDLALGRAPRLVPDRHLDGTPADPTACDDPFAGAVVDDAFVAYLRGADLAKAAVMMAPGGRAFAGRDMSGTNLGRVLFVGATPNFVGTDLTGVVLDDVDLSGATFSGLPIDGGLPTAAKLDRASLRGAKLAGAFLPAVTLEDAQLDGAVFDGADLTDADLRGATLSSTSGRASFERALLARADLTSVTADGVSFNGAHLLGGDTTPVVMTEASLGDAKFEGAILTKVDFDAADLRGASFIRSVCGGCIFTNANLADADFTSSSQVGSLWNNPSQLGGVKLANARIVDGSGSFTAPVAPLEVGPMVTYNRSVFPAASVGAAASCPNGQVADSQNGCTGKMEPDAEPSVPECSSSATFRCPGVIDTWKLSSDGGVTKRHVARSLTANLWVATTDGGDELIVRTADGATAVGVSGIKDGRGITALPDGTFVVADASLRQLVRLTVTARAGATPTVTVSPFAGTGAQGDAGDGGPATAATFTSPEGVWADAEGVVYMTDMGSARVRRIRTDGSIELVTAQSGLVTPMGITGDVDGRLFVADPGAHRVLTFLPGISSGVFAGSGAATGAPCLRGGCVATEVPMGEPVDVAVVDLASTPTADAIGTRSLLIVDRAGNVVYVASMAGTLGVPLAGAGTGDDGGLASDAALSEPLGVSADPGAGRIYVTEAAGGSGRVRTISSP